MEFYSIMKVLEEEKPLLLRKITRGLSRIRKGLEKCLYLGNINSKRLVMQKIMLKCNGKCSINRPEDFVIATGRMKVLEDFVN